MKKLLQKRLNNEKGLTLVELLAVIVILGIIAAIAIPSIGGIIQGSREKAVIADAQNTLSAANLYFVDNNSKDTDKVEIADLIADGFMEDAGQLDSATVTKTTGGNTITFSGKAGTKTVSGTTLTKTDLNEKENVTVN
ncbi:prepilin-type N-terminal cleavage/methylation domain-containing protein [Sporosarcina psychrophila]|uniref:Type IV pilus assembly protein PilA n=1 Tax=Sporosarcina psychrophila TaxID=1476 RepID=A0ABV2KG61_SPOPS